MANSFESQAEEDKRKKMEYSSSAPNKSWHVNSASKKLITIHREIRALHSQKLRGAEVRKAIMFLMLGLYKERGKKVFTPFFLPHQN